MATKTKKQTKVQPVKREYKSNVIQFSSVRKTKNGIAIWLGKENVIFVSDGLLNYIRKAS